jgi:transcriptional regulator with XRE-family HTH domain
MGNEIGRRIAQARIAKGWTQKELAKFSGCSKASICHYESGYQTPRLKAFVAIAKVLGVSIYDLDPTAPITPDMATTDIPEEAMPIIDLWSEFNDSEKFQMYRVLQSATSRISAASRVGKAPTPPSTPPKTPHQDTP